MVRPTFIIFGGVLKEVMSKKLNQSPEEDLPQESAEHYRQCAEDALRRANEATSPDQRNGYLKMAAGWHQMATDKEKTRKNSQTPAPKTRPRKQDQH